MYRNKAILAGAPGLAISVVRLEELDSTEHWKHTNYLKHCRANILDRTRPSWRQREKLYWINIFLFAGRKK